MQLTFAFLNGLIFFDSDLYVAPASARLPVLYVAPAPESLGVSDLAIFVIYEFNVAI